MSSNKRFKAPGEDRQLENVRIYKKTTKWHQEILSLFSSKDTALCIMGGLALMPVIMPQYFDICRLAFFMLFTICIVSNRKFKLPLKLPQYADRIDYNDAKPGRKAYSKAAGILYIGNDTEGYELWLRDTDIKTHMLIYGTTGSGKTVSLQSISYNAFVMGTGLCYIDPKGDPKLAHELFIMCRRMSREDDFLAMDFMTSGKKSEEHTSFRMSNTTNPFASAPADGITNLLSSLLPPTEGGNAVFAQKAQALLMAMVPVIVALRDAKQPLPLTDMSTVAGINRRQHSLGSGMDITTIRDYMDPVSCVSLVFPMKAGKDGGKKSGGLANERYKGAQGSLGMPRGQDRFEKKKDKPDDGSITPDMEECEAIARYVDAPLLDVMKSALSSLNFNPGAGEPSKQTAYLDQFGYAKGYFGQPLATISGMYGHIFNVSSGEIDMYDCLFNRRVLVGILPSLEKSPQECENLGKILLASIKNSVSGGLGTRLEGKTKEVTGALPSASKTPGIIVVDEYAAIMMPGFEIILTQARSLGFMAIIASQDYSGMKGKDAKSCDQIVENTKIKLFMTMASAKETWDLAKSLFGSINVEEANLEEPERRGAIRNISRVQEFDLMSQIEGEFHAFYKGELIRGATPYMIPQADYHHNMRINRFVRTDIAPERVEKNLAKIKPDNTRFTEDEVQEWFTRIQREVDYCIFAMEPDEEDVA